jgi:hypothetical protein
MIHDPSEKMIVLYRDQTRSKKMWAGMIFLLSFVLGCLFIALRIPPAGQVVFGRILVVGVLAVILMPKLFFTNIDLSMRVSFWNRPGSFLVLFL